MSRGVVCRCISDPKFLWLWRRPAATALIRSPNLKTCICRGCGPKKTKDKKKKKKDKILEMEDKLVVARGWEWGEGCGYG